MLTRKKRVSNKNNSLRIIDGGRRSRGSRGSRGGPQRGGPQRGGPQRGGPQRGGPQRGGPDKAAQKRADAAAKKREAAAAKKREAEAARQRDKPQRSAPDPSLLTALPLANPLANPVNEDPLNQGNLSSLYGNNNTGAGPNANGNGTPNSEENANGNGTPNNEENANGNGIPNSENNNNNGNGISNGKKGALGAAAAVGVGATAARMARGKTKKANLLAKNARTRRKGLSKNMKSSNYLNSDGKPMFPPKHISSYPKGFKAPGLIVEINVLSLNKSVSFSPFITTIIGKDSKSRVVVGQFVGPGPDNRGIVAYEVYGAGPDDISNIVEVFREWSEKNDSPTGIFGKAAADIVKGAEAYAELLETKIIELKRKLDGLVGEDYDEALELINKLEASKDSSIEQLAAIMESQKELETNGNR